VGKRSRQKRERRRRESPGEAAGAQASPPGNDPLADFAGRVRQVLTARSFLPGVLLLAACLRIANVLALRESPWFTELVLDHRVYDEWAQAIAAGDWAGSEVFFLAPLYPYFLACVYGVFGHDLLIARLVQAALGVGTCYLVSLLGRRLFGLAVGNAAALFAAVFAPSIYYESMIEKTALSVFLITLALNLFFARSARARFLAGVVLGLAALTRGNFLALVPLGFIALVLLDARRRDPLARLSPGRLVRWRALESGVFFLAGAALIVGTVTLRNHAVGGEWVLTTSNAGMNLFIGNNAENDSPLYRAPGFSRPDPRFEQADFQQEAERRAGRPLSAGEASGYWSGEAWDHILDHPGRSFGLFLRKLRAFWIDYEIPDNNHYAVVSTFSPVLRLPLLGFGTMVPFALLAVLVSFRTRQAVLVLAGFVTLYCLSIAAFFVFSRFRVQIAPALFVLTALGLQWSWREVRERRWNHVGLAAGVVLVATVFCFSTPSWLEPEKGLAIAYNNLGVAYERKGEPARAIEIFEHAVRTAPASVIGAMRRLGDLYLEVGRYEESERHMQQVVTHKPESRRGWLSLVALYDRLEATGRGDAAVRQKRAQAARNAGGSVPPPAAGPGVGTTPRVAGAPRANEHYRQSRVFQEEGRWAEAIEQLEKGIEIGPYNESARYSVGNLMLEHGEPDAIIDYFSKSAASDPKPQTSHYFWGRALAKKGDADGAIRQFQKALEIDPAHEMSQYQWGVVLEQQGDLEAALVHYEEASIIHPEFRAAHDACARLLDASGRSEDARRHRDQADRIEPGSNKAYLYWGRYLIEKGRYAAAIPELRKAIEADPDDAEALYLLENAQDQLGSGALNDEQRSAFLSTLARSGPGHPVWFATSVQDADSVALQSELQRLFRSAGWNVRANAAVSFRLKPGVFFFAADANPPQYAVDARAALEAAGLDVAGGTGYRSYYQEQKQTNPSWRGFDMADDQTFVVVVGPQGR
jgi:tetratricopeptide (TPR) repeat protein